MRQPLAFARLLARIADGGGVIADEEDDLVAKVLESAQLLQGDEVPDVQIGAGGVDAQVDAQRPAEPQLVAQL